MLLQHANVLYWLDATRAENDDILSVNAWHFFMNFNDPWDVCISNVEQKNIKQNVTLEKKEQLFGLITLCLFTSLDDNEQQLSPKVMQLFILYLMQIIFVGKRGFEGLELQRGSLFEFLSIIFEPAGQH